MPGILALLSRHAKTVVAAGVAVVVFAETMFPSPRFEHAITAAIGAYLVWQVPNAPKPGSLVPGVVGPDQLRELEKLLAARLGLVPGSPPPPPPVTDPYGSPAQPVAGSTFKAYSSPASSPGDPTVSRATFPASSP